MEIVTSWMEQGIVKGRAQGKAEGERNVVLRLLKRQVGTWPKQTSEALDRLSTTQIEALADALLEFRSLEDLTAWLGANV